MTGFPSIPRNASGDLITQTLNRVNRGKFNAALDVTLTASAASTTIMDERLSVDSAVIFDPMTSNAALEIAAGTCYITTTNRGNGSAVITHANNAQTDRTFRLLIIG